MAGDPFEQGAGNGDHVLQVSLRPGEVRGGDHAGVPRQGGDARVGLHGVLPDQPGDHGTGKHVVPQPGPRRIRWGGEEGQLAPGHFEAGDRCRGEGGEVVLQVVAEEEDQHHAVGVPVGDALAHGEEVGPETVAVHPPVHRLVLTGGAPRQAARQALRKVRFDVDLVGLEERIPEKDDAAAPGGRPRRPFMVVESPAVRGHHPGRTLHLAGPGNAEVGPAAEPEQLVVLQGGLLEGDDPGQEELRQKQGGGRRGHGDGAVHRQGAQPGRCP